MYGMFLLLLTTVWLHLLVSTGPSVVDLESPWCPTGPSVADLDSLLGFHWSFSGWSGFTPWFTTGPSAADPDSLLGVHWSFSGWCPLVHQ